MEIKAGRKTINADKMIIIIEKKYWKAGGRDFHFVNSKRENGEAKDLPEAKRAGGARP